MTQSLHSRHDDAAAIDRERKSRTVGQHHGSKGQATVPPGNHACLRPFFS